MQQLADEATTGNLNVNRFKAEVTKWRLAKLDPDRFGDKAEVSVSHRSGPSVKAVEIEVIEPGSWPQVSDHTAAADVVDAEAVPVAQQAPLVASDPEPASKPIAQPPEPAGPGITPSTLQRLLGRPSRPKVFF